MEVLSIKGTSQYPEVLLNSKTGILEFSGNSLPEDAKGFFEPIIDWINNYIESPCEVTTITFRMIYYNTPSSKILFQLLKKFESIHLKKSTVKIIWQHPDDDIDMKEAGADLSEHVKVPFDLQSYKE
ncbi:MAG: nuclear pore complex subunit [Bacteroidetes bacterium HGW-Bacteroidetes-15]|nr:MAG: nuclear pore complex subunit [Bacteroidetes bacterium HGW-Bacteroidetes-15]